jgi:hypothetical protein
LVTFARSRAPTRVRDDVVIRGIKRVMCTRERYVINVMRLDYAAPGARWKASKD